MCKETTSSTIANIALKMQTPNTGVFQTTLQQQIKRVDFVFKSLDEQTADKLKKTVPDFNNIPQVLHTINGLMQHFLKVMNLIAGSSADRVGLDLIKESYCDFTGSLRLLEGCLKISNNQPQYSSELKKYETLLSENAWQYKNVKDYISKATRLSFQSNIQSRFNSLLNGGDTIIEKSRIIENLSSPKSNPSVNSMGSFNSLNSLLGPTEKKQNTALLTPKHPPVIPNRPRSISPSPELNSADSRLLDYYSSKRYIDIQTLMDIYHKFDHSVLLIDFRSSVSFKHDHISLFTNIVNIDPLSVKPQYIVQDIVDHSLLLASNEEQMAFKNLRTYELVILLDQSSIQAKLSQSLLRFLAILDEKNSDKNYTLKRKPIILDGGFDEWSFFMNNQANGPIPNLRVSSPISMNSPSSPSYQNYVHTQPLISRSPSPIGYFANNGGSSINIDNNHSNFVHSSNSNFSVVKNNSKISTLTPVLNPKPVRNPQLLVPLTPENSSKNRSRSPSPSFRMAALTSTLPPTMKPGSSVFSSPLSASSSSNAHAPTPIKTIPPKRAPVLLSGLYNLGNSCYMNSTLQCLMGTKELTNYLLQGLYQNFVAKDSKLGSHGKLTNEYQTLAKLMLDNTSKRIATNPKSFKKVVGEINAAFDNCDQQDSAEFLHFLLDTIHEDLNWSANKEALPAITEQDEANREALPIRLASTIEWERYLKTDYSSIIEIFAGQYASRLECGNCHKTSTTYIPFNMLSVPIPAKNGALKLTDCIDSFVSPEILTGSNAWKCSRCKLSTTTKKQLTITRLPSILIIHLERFSISGGRTYEYVKNTRTIDVPLVLQMEKYWPVVRDEQELEQLRKFPSRGQEGKWEYNLFGVVRHYGTLNGGHYISEVKKNNNWVKFDDDKMSSSSMGKQGETDGSAYILFYEKVR